MVNKQHMGNFSLDAYSLKRLDPSDIRAELSTTIPLQITLFGKGFLIISFDPQIMIGNIQLQDYEILSDEETIVGYLYETPPEGGVISIDYGLDARVELPERFSLSKLTES
ncbi:MAG: hypothetical protein HC908_03975 [Calothrix sp. SM1_7_51]|nr:hypothetical protein [Calothrix sp. SM1_7_51]